MSRTIRLLVAVIVAIGFSRPAVAEDNAPLIRITLSNADSVLDDVKFILGLTNKEQQEQWPVLKDYLEIFLIGIDRTQPFRFDMLPAGTAVRTRNYFPVSDFKEFRDDNLDAFGIVCRRKGSTLYKLEMNREEFGYLRYRNKYATIAEEQQDVPLNIDAPFERNDPLLAKGYGISLDINNAAEGLKERRDSFQKIRDELLAAVKQKKDEHEADFKLRKLFAEQQMNELERFFVESEKVVVGWKLDAAKKTGRIELELEPLPDTDLAATIEEFNHQPSRFANVAQPPDPILAVRFNHPLDEMRQGHLLESWKELRARTQQRIADDAKADADEKANRNKVTDLFFDMLVDGTKMGLVNGFLDATQTDEGVTVVGGLKVPDGDKLVDIVKLLVDANFAEEVQQDFDKQGDIAIHKVTVATRHREQIQAYLADDNALYLGTGKDTIWCATGVDAVGQLKGAIAQAVEAEPDADLKDAPFLSGMIKLGAWTKLRDERVAREQKANPQKAADKPVVKKEAAEGEGEAAAFEQLIADRDALRQLALEAFAPADDTVTFRLQRVGDGVEGEVNIEPGLLRFVGAMLSKFSKDNLAED